jgi:thiamine biosynthesis lipoprotein
MNGMKESVAVEAKFDAMGSPAHALVNGDRELLEAARRRIEDLEAKWSRFRPTSEISRLNESGSVIVSSDTMLLVERAIHGWRATGGRFDPTVYDAMVALGYDRTFQAVGTPRLVAATRPSPGCAGIVLDPSLGLVALPRGVHLDPGGIGKGLAADLVVAELMDDGARGAMVSIGGDLRAEGEPPVGSAWSIAIDEPAAGGDFGVVTIVAGAVATSTTQIQRWTVAGEAVHHLIDPSVGRPHRGDVVLVTAVAAEGWWAEVATKDLMGRRPGEPGLENTAALVVTADGSAHLVGGMEEYLT